MLKMTLDFNSTYKLINKLVKKDSIDLSKVSFIHPWPLLMICLLLIESPPSQKKLIIPKDRDACTYLSRMHLPKILRELGYEDQAQAFSGFESTEQVNLNIHEILHCSYRDDFNARLGRFISMFQNFGLSIEDSQRATAVIGELGNNVFDHNSGSWPANTVGCIIAAQHYPKKRTIEIAIADPGIGFLGSLNAAFPNMKDDIAAIKMGLAGNSGRIGEVRGNGLRLVQHWTINNFLGTVMIHSGNGLVVVDRTGIKSFTVNKIAGTLAQFVINYAKL